MVFMEVKRDVSMDFLLSLLKIHPLGFEYDGDSD
jgi:hypothetical protein